MNIKILSKKDKLMRGCFSFLLLITLSSFTLSSELNEGDYFGKWILLETPRENEKCKEIAIDSNNTKCFVIYIKEPQAYGVEGENKESDYVSVDKNNNIFTYRYWRADFLIEAPINMKIYDKKHLFYVESEGWREIYVLEPIKNSVLAHWYRIFSPDEKYEYTKNFYIKEEKAKELNVPIYEW